MYEDEWNSTEEEEAEETEAEEEEDEETDRTEAEQWETRWLGFEDYESRLAGAYSTNKISELGEVCRNSLHFHVENDRKKRRQDEQDGEGRETKLQFALCLIHRVGWASKDLDPRGLRATNLYPNSKAKAKAKPNSKANA